MGKGSEFFFELVFDLSNSTNGIQSTLTQQRVLIADANKTVRRLLESMVISLGWNAQVVDSGEKGLASLAAQGADYFDLLLLDWCMPEMNGIQTAATVHNQLGKTHGLIIVMVTAHDRTVLLEQAGSELVDAFISKPCFIAAIRYAIAKTQ